MDQLQQQPQQPLPNATPVLVLGILSIVMCFCYGILGLILGIIALVLSASSKRLYMWGLVFGMFWVLCAQNLSHIVLQYNRKGIKSQEKRRRRSLNYSKATCALRGLNKNHKKSPFFRKGLSVFSVGLKYVQPTICFIRMHHILRGWFFLVGRKCMLLSLKHKPQNVKLIIFRIYTHQPTRMSYSATS